MAEIKPAPRRIPPATIVLVLAALLAVAAIVFSLSRGGETAATNTAVPATGPAAGADPGAAIAAMRERLARDPDNHEAWFLLGRTYREMEQIAEAEQAFRRASELMPANADYLGYRAEALLLLGTDERRAEAQRLFRRVVELDGGNAMARFYLATMRDMGGDPNGAINDLVALLQSAPPGAPWFDHVRSQTEQLARRRNIDVASRLPAPRQSTATAGIPGPTQQQLDAARSLPPSEQEEMARGMVDRLAARLAQNPRDERGWIMLMRSRMVRGEAPAAAEALRSGLAAFADDAAVQQRLRTAAAELGIPPG